MVQLVLSLGVSGPALIGIAEDVRGAVAVDWRWLRQHFVHNRFSEAVYGSVEETTNEN